MTATGSPAHPPPAAHRESVTWRSCPSILWRERELLDTLLYRLEVEQLVLASGRTDRLMRAAQDVESTLE